MVLTTMAGDVRTDHFKLSSLGIGKRNNEVIIACHLNSKSEHLT